MISQETIKEFQQTVQEELGHELDDSTSQRVLLGLVDFFDLLAKIDHRKNISAS